MKCQHCGSADLVTIQGQQFCLNCGYKVELIPEPKSPVVNTATTPLKPHPRAKKLPRPANAKVAHRVSQSRSDISKPADQPKPSRIPVHPIRFTFETATALGVLAGLLAGGVVWLNVENDIALMVLVFGAGTAFVYGLLAQSALMFGVSRYNDRRPAPHRLWWVAARAGFMDSINLGLIATVCALAIGAAAFVCWKTVLQLQLAPIAEAATLALANTLAIWALLGVYIARRVGSPAVVIGGHTASQAFTNGWRMYLRAGGHLVAAVLEVVLARLTIIGTLGVVAYAAYEATPHFGRYPEAALVAAAVFSLVFVAVFTLMEVEARLWLVQYRHWVGILEPRQRVAMLTGRSTKRIKP